MIKQATLNHLVYNYWQAVVFLLWKQIQFKSSGNTESWSNGPIKLQIHWTVSATMQSLIGWRILSLQPRGVAFFSSQKNSHKNLHHSKNPTIFREGIPGCQAAIGGIYVQQNKSHQHTHKTRSPGDSPPHNLRDTTQAKASVFFAQHLKLSPCFTSTCPHPWWRQLPPTIWGKGPPQKIKWS